MSYQSISSCKVNNTTKNGNNNNSVVHTRHINDSHNSNPQNQIHQLIPQPNYPVDKEPFTSKSDDYASAIIKLSNMSLRCLVTESCPYCRNLINALNNNNIRFMVIDINSYQASTLPDNVKTLAKNGVPCVIGVVDPSKSKYSVVNGFNNINDLANSLYDEKNHITINSSVPQPAPTKTPSSSKGGDEIVVITMDGCGWCKKLLDEIKGQKYKHHKHSDPELKGLSFRGFPAICKQSDINNRTIENCKYGYISKEEFQKL